MHEEKLAALQAQYDRLVARRQGIIGVYDRSPDGTRQKHQAVRGLDAVGYQIMRVEQEMALLTRMMP